MLDHLKTLGGKGYGYLLEIFVPMLLERGVEQTDIDKMLITNPARVFSRERRT
jgi:phosphotriesterase-related protein